MGQNHNFKSVGPHAREGPSGLDAGSVSLPLLPRPGRAAAARFLRTGRPSAPPPCPWRWLAPSPGLLAHESPGEPPAPQRGNRGLGVSCTLLLRPSDPVAQGSAVGKPVPGGQAPSPQAHTSLPFLSGLPSSPSSVPRGPTCPPGPEVRTQRCCFPAHAPRALIAPSPPLPRPRAVLCHGDRPSPRQDTEGKPAREARQSPHFRHAELPWDTPWGECVDLAPRSLGRAGNCAEGFRRYHCLHPMNENRPRRGDPFELVWQTGVGSSRGYCLTGARGEEGRGRSLFLRGRGWDSGDLGFHW